MLFFILNPYKHSQVWASGQQTELSFSPTALAVVLPVKKKREKYRYSLWQNLEKDNGKNLMCVKKIKKKINVKRDRQRQRESMYM